MNTDWGCLTARGIKHLSWERGLIAVFLTTVWAGSLAYHGFRGDVQSDLAIGRWILAHHQVPHRNLWMTAAWHHSFSDTEWLYGVMVALLYRTGGRLAIYGFGVTVIAGLSVGLAGWIVRISPVWRWPVTVVMAFLLSPAITPRPVLLTFLGWWAVVEAIRRYRANGQRTWLWIVAALTVVWTQIHMTVVLVPIALAWEMLAGMPERRRALAGPLGLAIVGTVARVGGVGSAAGFLGHVLTPLILTHIIEWMPPDPRTWRGVFVFGWLFGVWSSVWPVLRRQHDWVSQGWLIGGTGAALFAQRFVPYMAIGTLMLLMTHVPPSRSGARGWRTGMLVALTTPVLGLMALTIRQSGVFRPAWPASALTFLQKHHATNIVSRSGDTLTGAGLIPWVNGQIQLVSDAPWLPLWLDTIQGTVEPAQFVARADPTSRWIVWPLDRAPGLPVRMPSSWRMVWRGDIRWNGGFQKIPSAIWERVAPDACLQCNRHGLAVCSGCRVSSVSHLHATGWDTLYPIPVPSSTPCGFPMNTADGHSYSEVLHSTHGSHP